MAFAVGAIVDGTWTPVQAAALLGALATKGEASSEVVGAAEALRARSTRVEHDLDVVVDTCGTGGDGAQTINVSTAAGFVLAGLRLTRGEARESRRLEFVRQRRRARELRHPYR